jgi:O-antigen/teichoic acid export membrane protein
MPRASERSEPKTEACAPERASYRSGFAFGTLSFFAVAGLGVFSTIVTARLYGVRIIGQYALVWAPVAALWVLSTAKEQQALIREITCLPPRHPRVTELFAAVFTFSWGLTALVSVLDAVVCWLVFPGALNAPELLAPAFASIANYALVMNTGWNIDSVLSAFVAGRQIFWVRLNEVVSFMVIAIGIGLFWRSVWGLVIAIIGASIITLIHRVIVVRPFVLIRLSREQYRSGLRVLPELLRFGLKATPGELAQGISQQGGIWALGTVAPIAVVGAYSRAYTIPWRLQQASNRISEVLFPTLVGRHTSGDGEGFDRALVDSIRYELAGMLMIGAAIGGAARSVLAIFGPGFATAATALSLLAVFPALASVTLTQTQALWATDRPARSSVIAGVRLVVTLTLLVLLTPRLGTVGPAIALLAGYLVVVVLSGLALAPSLSRPLRHTWPLQERFALVAAYAAGFAAAHVCQNAARATPGLLLALAAGSLTYAALFLALGGLNARDRRRLGELGEWIRERRERRATVRRPAPEGGS